MRRVSHGGLKHGRLVLLADDLTGACDVGAAALRRGWRVRCVLASLPGWHRDAAPRTGEAVVIDLETRRLPEPAAVRRVRQVGRWLATRDLAPAYFKVDSTLRGHPVAEAAALRAGRRIWFVPANPRMGRTVRRHRLLVNGVRVERSAFARDPLHPVASGDLHRLTRPLRAGAGCEIPEVTGERDLRTIATRVRRNDLVVGAAALAGYVIPKAGRSRAPARHPVPGKSHARRLAVIGSMNPVSAQQVAQAVQVPGTTLFRLGPRSAGRPVHRFFGRAPGLSILALSPEEYRRALGGTPARRRLVGERIARALARSAAGVIRRWRPDSLILSGGLTAAAVCEELRVRSLTLIGESAPGVVESRAEWPGGRAHVLTKPGGFGGGDALTGGRRQ